MPIHLFSRAQSRIICAAVIVSLLSGCAAQKTFDEGSQLVRQDKVEEGLQKMQQASQMDPAQVEFKTMYYVTRDASIGRYLEKADSAVGAGRYQEASELYNRVLGIDANNHRAKDGLKQIEVEQRHDKLLDEGGQLFQTGDVDRARLKLSVVMAEDPSNVSALRLQSSIAEKTAPPTVSMTLKQIYKRPITLQFKDATLKQIFEVISQSSGLNFIFDKDVKTDQKTSIFLKDSSIESAIYYTLMTNQLDQQVMDGNTILVYPNSAAKQKDYQEMVVKSFFLTNTDAKLVAATLRSIIKTHDIVVDEKLNMIIMRDTPDAIRLAEKLVALHDIAEPEVMLEVTVMEVKRTKLQDLGVQWPNNLTLTPLTPLAALSNANGGISLNGGSASANNPLLLSDLKGIRTNNLAIGNPSAVANAHSTDGDANLLANPRIRTRNHEKAKIMIGDRVPNITVNTAVAATSFVSETITYVDVGLKLEIEPTVYLDNEVGIKISLEVSNIVSQLITKSGSSAYQIGTRNASSVLRLKDGETQILAGLLDDEERHTVNKIPALGDIPILGHLFGSTNDDLQKTEIILSITPHLINNIHRPEASVSEFSSGTENNLKPRPQVTGSLAIASSDAPAVPVKQASFKKKNGQQNNTADSAPVNQSVTSAQALSPQASGAEIIPLPAADTSGLQEMTRASAGSMNLVLNMPGQSSARVGSTFTVQVNAQSQDAVGSLPVVVGFDPKSFEVVSVEEGDFLKNGNAKSGFSNEIDTRGQVVMKGTSSGGQGGSGTVAVIHFKVIAGTGSPVIQIVSATPLGADGRAINVNAASALTVPIVDPADN